jgi:hypothetical protein
MEKLVAYHWACDKKPQILMRKFSIQNYVLRVIIAQKQPANRVVASSMLSPSRERSASQRTKLNCEYTCNMRT